MPDLLLSTLNAKFIHASFGLRCLFANLGDLQARAEILEFEIKQTPLEIVEALLSRNPRIIGLGVYIWNARPSLEVVALLKRLRPEILVVLGGPEVSYESADQEIVALADHTLTGEADLAFADLCRQLLDSPPASPPSTPASPPPPPPPPSLPKIIPAPLPDLARVELPYAFYSDADLAHRVVYVEASRGCPFTCEFCLSSLDLPVRQFPLERFLRAMAALLDRGLRRFKFVDRTFNLNLPVSRAILRFFRERWCEGLFLHFEMVPDRLPAALREEIAWFPPGALQFEIGIQSFDPEVCARISRRQDLGRTEENFRYLRQHTGVHIHADLIAGLPGETLEGFGAGFDRLVALAPQEIQFGILKRLRGTPITRHDAEWGMRYSPLPPYEILENSTLPFATLQRLRRFARYWDLVANSGRFVLTTPHLWRGPLSPFHAFLAFSDWLFAETRQTHAISLDRLAQHLFRWLTRDAEGDASPATIAESLAQDWRASGQRDLPPWLTPHLPQQVPAAAWSAVGRSPTGLPARQARHSAPSLSPPPSS